MIFDQKVNYKPSISMLSTFDAGSVFSLSVVSAASVGDPSAIAASISNAVVFFFFFFFRRLGSNTLGKKSLSIK